MTAPHATPQQIGAALEDTLALLHVRYEADGLAHLYHCGTTAIKVGDEWIPQDSRPDWGGSVYGSGKAIVFDSKHCLEDVYRHDTKKRAHQLREIWAAHQTHAIAGILVVNTKLDLGWWLWPSPEWQVGQFTARMLGPDVGYSIPVPAHPSFPFDYVPDWFSVVRESQ